MLVWGQRESDGESEAGWAGHTNPSNTPASHNLPLPETQRDTEHKEENTKAKAVKGICIFWSSLATLEPQKQFLWLQARWWCKKRKFENYRIFNVDFPPVKISRSKCAHCISDVGLTDFLSSDVVWIHRMAGERWELLPLLGVDLILMCVTVAAFICHMCGPVEPSSALPSGNLALPIPKPVHDEKHKYTGCPKKILL